MGYYTVYELEIDKNEKVPICGHNSGEHKFCPECGVAYNEVPLLKKLKEEILATYENAGFEESDQVKWYDNEKDMRAFSLKYPAILFTLHGKGEVSEDVWRKYFKAGKMQFAKAKLTFDDYDKRKLK